MFKNIYTYNDFLNFLNNEFKNSISYPKYKYKFIIIDNYLFDNNDKINKRTDKIKKFINITKNFFFYVEYIFFSSQCDNNKEIANFLTQKANKKINFYPLYSDIAEKMNVHDRYWLLWVAEDIKNYDSLWHIGTSMTGLFKKKNYSTFAVYQIGLDEIDEISSLISSLKNIYNWEED
ncbi:hypothetical protein LN42_06405 [Marinitoga sp. 1137]|uniref:hypothetical protein n=1 Tax=Marinitoga sp. 1137 TaxID=1545835 RepID=UPI0009505386|nr:hypothetical protein [Marinitoga sp. 1137]APT76053.1 hypothetical protein LN42_06405 [Marinitoga sp. 1137]